MGPVALAGIGAGLSLAGNVYSGIKSAKAVKEQKGLINDFDGDIQSWYDTNYNQDFLGTNVASSILTRSQQQLRDANMAAENKGAVTGATTEANLASKTANQKQYANNINRLAAMGTARQGQVEGRYMAAKPFVLSQKTGMLDKDIESAQNMAQNSGNLMDSVMDLTGFMI